MNSVRGIHHITAISGDAQENLDFYTGVLGLRLVKRSVNQDAPGTYHLFYADAEGRPGTDLTFFPWPELPPARPGTGLAMEAGFAVPPGSLAFWAERLTRARVPVDAQETRFGQATLPFRDPHGLPLSLTEFTEAPAGVPWKRSPVEERHQIRGFHAVRLWERDLGVAGRFLREVLGFRESGEERGWHRFEAAGGGSSRMVEVRELPGGTPGTWGRGGVHHVAFRVADEAHQSLLRGRVAAAGIPATGMIDRFWFRSVYFHEPGGVLFELATDGPGFAVDESGDQLGERLILPPWLEPRRKEIEAALPLLHSAAEPAAAEAPTRRLAD
ncbi:MAG TPA: ring-cleaving dioxygenase [Candidatus Eisenbacteria bacterium]|jgi:glyoxalase family protein